MSETIDTTAERAADPDVWVTTETGELIPNYDASFPTITEGEVVHGTVVRVDKDEVLVDIGYKSEGVIPVAELSIRRSVNPADEVGVGEEIDALVLTKEDAEGRLILSKKRARFELAWKQIEGAAESGEPVIGRVIEVVKGGLILDLGVRGFLPASLVDIRRVQDLDEFLGKELRCKVIELNRSRNNVVLSRRAVLEDERKEQRQAILDRLSPGDVVEGTISNIVDFGAFVDLDGMDGLIHISELSWTHVNHPSEVLEIGQPVKVKVLDIDRDRQRISLGLKQTQSDPWQQVLESYNQGDVVEGRVTKVVTFGAFVEILPGVEGLVHISELAAHHVENPREVVSQGDTVRVKIIEVDAERRRLSLSLKRVEEGAPVRTPDGAPPQLDLSEDVFGDGSQAAAEDAIAPHGEAGTAPEDVGVGAPEAEDAAPSAESEIAVADEVAVDETEPEDTAPQAEVAEGVAVEESEPEALVAEAVAVEESEPEAPATEGVAVDKTDPETGAQAEAELVVADPVIELEVEPASPAVDEGPPVAIVTPDEVPEAGQEPPAEGGDEPQAAAPDDEH
jgi:small subunit ribosomal protein S1